MVKESQCPIDNRRSKTNQKSASCLRRLRTQFFGPRLRPLFSKSYPKLDCFIRFHRAGVLFFGHSFGLVPDLGQLCGPLPRIISFIFYQFFGLSVTRDELGLGRHLVSLDYEHF
ncbi:hypothetical protein TNCV_1174791 [Trichonephila clavipes]|nr:hypothetical protein TNCV_1174791 [Trichonephila clavipes]